MALHWSKHLLFENWIAISSNYMKLIYSLKLDFVFLVSNRHEVRTKSTQTMVDSTNQKEHKNYKYCL